MLYLPGADAKRLTRAVILITVLMLLPWTAFAADGEQAITVPVHTPVCAVPPTWDFPYDDGFFAAPATTYNHRLAQGSLGLALAAYRQKNEDLQHKDQAVRRYLTEAGFTSLDSQDYDVTPSVDTIATLMGRKTLGDSTLIAVAVSGGDYQKEWESNFTISVQQYDNDEMFHDGFANAAFQVVSRVLQYINNEKITGDIKIWLTGYSRAAAVSNLTAYALLESNTVTDENLYAYTFATPRCTTGMVARDCPGVFNIVGSFDPVPAVPFEEWGYTRYGNTLFLPAQELCADYETRKSAVEPLYKRLTGLDYWNNPQANWLCCKLMQSLDEVMRNAGDYHAALQQVIIDSMNLKGNTLVKLYRIYQMVNADTKLKSMFSDLVQNTDSLYSAIAYTLFRQWMGQEESHFNHGVSFKTEMIHEHCPDVYVAWMFSEDNPADLFITGLGYRQIVVSGDAEIAVTSADGAPLASPITFLLGEARMLTLPAAQEYTIHMTARADTRVSLMVLEREAQCMYARVMFFGAEDAAALKQGAAVTLTLPRGTGAKGDQFAVTGSAALALAADTETLGINDAYAAMEAMDSGDAATGFIARAIKIAAALLAALVLIILLVIVLICRHTVKKRRAAKKNIAET